MRCTFKTVFYVNGSKERNGNVVVDICMSYDKIFLQGWSRKKPAFLFTLIPINLYWHFTK